MEHLYIADLICMELIYGTHLTYCEVAAISRLLKIRYFSFAKYSLFYRALLQKRPVILRIEAIPPYGTHLTYTELIYGTSFYTGTPLYS